VKNTDHGAIGSARFTCDICCLKNTTALQNTGNGAEVASVVI